MAVPKPMKAQDLSREVDLTCADLGLGQYLNVQYVMEPKVDGCRIMLELHATGNLVLSRGRDVSDHFPHLRDATMEGVEGVLLDGELLANGPDGRILSAATSLLVSTPDNAVQKQREYGPAWMMVFDILSMGDVTTTNVMRENYDERRHLMSMIIEGGDAFEGLAEIAEFHASVIFETSPDTELAIQLLPSYEATAENIDLFRGIEGFMIKDRGSKYQPGGRDGSGWFKFKWLHTADAFITGFKPGENSLTGQVGSVTLSILVPDPKGTLPMRVGTDIIAAKTVEVATVGVFTNEFRRELTGPDGGLNEDYWCKVMEFSCQGIGTGGMARHPRFVRMRPDKVPADCGPEQIAPIPRV